VALLACYDIISVSVSFRTYPILRYTSWSLVHDNFGLVTQVSEIATSPLFHSSLVLGTYMPTLYSIVFFVFFGLGEEAVSEYMSRIERMVDQLDRMGLIKRK